MATVSRFLLQYFARDDNHRATKMMQVAFYNTRSYQNYTQIMTIPFCCTIFRFVRSHSLRKYSHGVVNFELRYTAYMLHAATLATARERERDTFDRNIETPVILCAFIIHTRVLVQQIASL